MLIDVLNRAKVFSQDASLKIDDLGNDVTAYRLQSRWTRMLGFEVSFYSIGDVLVDAGFTHAESLVLDALDDTEITAICCTHHHEDHTGNARALAHRHGCPIYIYRPELICTEGLDQLLPYRRLFWGAPGRIDCEAMVDRVKGKHVELVVVPTPGHSQTHVALFEPVSRTVFVGDLFVASGASAVMTHENPFFLIESLRQVAALEPRRMLTGHGGDFRDPVDRLLAKARSIERAVAESQRLAQKGMNPRTISVRVFSRGRTKDRVLEVLTQGEFSRLNFVKAAIKNWNEGNTPRT